MSIHTEEKNAEALYAFLKGELNLETPELPVEEAALCQALLRAAGEMQADPQFSAQLEKKLLAAARQGKARNSSSGLTEWFSGLGRTLAYAGLALALVAGLSWVVRSLVPGDALIGAASRQTPSPVVSASPEASSTPLLGTEPASTPEGAGEQGELPGVTNRPSLSFAAGFPEAPAEAPVYQVAAGRPLTPDGALEAAARLGIEGQLYEYPSEAGGTNFLVSDGWSQVHFMGSLDYFAYTADITTVLEDHPDGLPFDEQAQLAGEWLVNRGLIADLGGYQAEALLPWPNTVRFVPLLEGRPVRFAGFEAPRIDVELDLQGKVTSLTYQLLQVQPAGALPVVAAEEAWRQAQAYREGPGVALAVRDAQPLQFQTWLREYPLDERVDLWDYASWLVPLDAGAPPLAYLRNYPLSGDVTGLVSQVSMGQFLHAWGQFREPEPGKRVFDLEGWEPAEENSGEGRSSQQYESREGTVRREGERAYFELGSGERLELPGLPASVPDGLQGTLWGKPQDNPEPYMEWHILQSGEGATGPVIRTGWLSPVSLVPVQPAPGPEPGVERGQRIEGLEGVLGVRYWEADSGERTLEVLFSSEPAEGFPVEFWASLSGLALPELESAHRATVRLWGTVTNILDGLPQVEVERWELAAPAPEVRAWMGTWETATLDGVQAVLFTSQDGAQYVFGPSFDMMAQSMVGRPGDVVIVEGVLLAGETLGGYPVIQMAGAQVPGRISDLSQYETQSDKPQVRYREPGGWEALPGGEIVIEQIELVYITEDTSHGSRSQDAPPLYLQPAWRFTGRYASGEQVEILVQAVPETYR